MRRLIDGCGHAGPGLVYEMSAGENGLRYVSCMERECLSKAVAWLMREAAGFAAAALAAEEKRGREGAGVVSAQ